MTLIGFGLEFQQISSDPDAREILNLVEFNYRSGYTSEVSNFENDFAVGLSLVSRLRGNIGDGLWG
jgi:hypothetical protein